MVCRGAVAGLWSALARAGAHFAVAIAGRNGENATRDA